MSSAEGTDIRMPETASGWRGVLSRFFRVTLLQLVFAYGLLLAVHAFLGHWTPDYLQGRDLWHFMLTRMIVPMVMLGALASLARLVPSALMLAAALLFVGTISAIKRDATGEPFQMSDLFLAGQSTHLLNYVSWDRWLLGAFIIPASALYLWSLRFRRWSLPLLAVCIGLLSTYRIEAVYKWIHDNSWWIGVEELTFSQAESERMNGLATHLYFSTAGLMLKTYGETEVSSAMEALPMAPLVPPLAGPRPDIYVVLGEAWWRDPSDAQSPLDQLQGAGFAEGTAVSPVYGGTTPNAEFEVLTGIPVKSFRAGIIPYQHYLGYVTDKARTLPRLLSEQGYGTAAFHNFTRRFWLRDQIYPRFGFARFTSMEDMTLTVQDGQWPHDDGLYASVLKAASEDKPQFRFLVTVETHGPYGTMANDVKEHEGVSDYRGRLADAAKALAAFKLDLDKKGRPYVVLAFGDHLPGLRHHQWVNGIGTNDPRLHQVPFLVASNTRAGDGLRQMLEGRPLFCFAPVLTQWLQLGIADRYFRHQQKTCGDTPNVTELPSGPVIQNQLFSLKPI